MKEHRQLTRKIKMWLKRQLPQWHITPKGMTLTTRQQRQRFQGRVTDSLYLGDRTVVEVKDGAARVSEIEWLTVNCVHCKKETPYDHVSAGSNTGWFEANCPLFWEHLRYWILDVEKPEAIRGESEPECNPPCS